MTKSLENKRILLIISGGIAAIKTPDLIKKIQGSGAAVDVVLTHSGGENIAKNITKNQLQALKHETPEDGGDETILRQIEDLIGKESIYTDTDMWREDRDSVWHIEFSRQADLIIAPAASANFMARVAYGIADDFATTIVLASDKPLMLAPAMNVKMWEKPATQRNLQTLIDDGALIVDPVEGEMACGEFGMGRMAEPEAIFDAITAFFADKPLKGLHALVTSGPTFEPIDPVRFLGNRSSGRQGHAIAAALAEAGAQVTLVSGPVALPDPPNVATIHVETAEQMLKACETALPADIAVCAAAVSDWSPASPQSRKMKKRGNTAPPTLKLKENPDILKTLSGHKNRPALIVGFAAETETLPENLIENAKEKLNSKGCDLILANDVSQKVFGSHENHVYLITRSGAEDWGKTSKDAVAGKLLTEIIDRLKKEKNNDPNIRAAE